MENAMENYGKRLHDIRVKIGLSQEQVAFLADITTSYYGQIERGTANPSIALLDKICNAMNITLADIFTNTEIILDGVDSLSRQVLFQLVGKNDKEKEIILDMVKQINKLILFENSKNQK